MPVEAVVRGVDSAADEPFGIREIPFEGFVERLEPMQVARAFGPERVRIFVGALAKSLVLVEIFNPRLGAELGRRRKLADSVSVESI